LNPNQSSLVHGKRRVKLDQRLQRVFGATSVTCNLSAIFKELSAYVEEHRRENRLLIGEMLIDRRSRHTARCTDRIDRCAVEASFGKESR